MVGVRVRVKARVRVRVRLAVGSQSPCRVQWLGLGFHGQETFGVRVPWTGDMWGGIQVSPHRCPLRWY